MSDHRAVHAIHDLVAAANRHQSDVPAFIALHHPDAVVVNVAGRRVLGREALREAMATALSGPLADVLTRLEIEDIRFFSPDVALVSCAKHISDQRGDEASVPTEGNLTLTVVRGPESWKIALAQTTPVL